MYNVQTTTFLGRGRSAFKRRDNQTGDKCYVAPRGSLNLLSYTTMLRLGLYIADAEAGNAISGKKPSTSDVKMNIVASLQQSFPDVSKDVLG
jgi:hypothetical protein